MNILDLILQHFAGQQAQGGMQPGTVQPGASPQASLMGAPQGMPSQVPPTPININPIVDALTNGGGIANQAKANRNRTQQLLDQIGQ